MQRIVGQGRRVRGGGVAIVNGNSKQTPVDLSAYGVISLPKKILMTEKWHPVHFWSKINRYFIF